MSIIVLVPSRGRPERLAAMLDSVQQTASGDVATLAMLDTDDPYLPAYVDILSASQPFVAGPRTGYTRSLNDAAATVWDRYSIIGAFGDDVLFRTPGWDNAVEAALETPGIAYGDDLIHGANHPSAVFMSSVIARHLTWLALPYTTHQWADDGWKILGQQTKTLRFVPEVVFEHRHPAVDKAPWDDTYAGVFNDERAKGDYEGFQEWSAHYLEADKERVRAALNDFAGQHAHYPTR